MLKLNFNDLSKPEKEGYLIAVQLLLDAPEPDYVELPSKLTRRLLDEPVQGHSLKDD